MHSWSVKKAMVTTNIQVRVDEPLKVEAEQLFADIGLDMPTAIRLFLKQSVVKWYSLST